MSNETTDFLFGLMPRIEHIFMKNGMFWFTVKYSKDLWLIAILYEFRVSIQIF